MNIENKKTRSINFKTLVYLIVFTISILFLLWVFQISFLNYFYEKYQVSNVNNIANKVKKSSNNFTSLELLAYENNVCIQVENSNGIIENYNTMMNGCELGRNKHIEIYKNEIIKSTDNVKALKIVNKNFDAKGILYGIKKNDSYIYIYSPLEDINSTTTILRNQLIYIIFIVMIIAIVVSYFLSKKITEPISIITKKAKKLGNGNYDICIENSDITEINDLAIALNETSKELSKTDELRRDLMANISHDLKTPLTMIKAYAEMLRDIKYTDEQKRVDHLNIIIDETDRLTILVNDILELTKEEANADFLKLEVYDLTDEIKNIIKKYEIIKDTENYNFILELPKKAEIKADKNKINQVIYNLVNNAINYTGEDKVVKIKVTDEDKNYLVEIIDTGKGISSKDINYIWDKYYKKEKNHKRNVVGSGVGLSIVKSILIKHNFEYGVNSKKKTGTTFYFKIQK